MISLSPPSLITTLKEKRTPQSHRPSVAPRPYYGPSSVQFSGKWNLLSLLGWRKQPTKTPAELRAERTPILSLNPEPMEPWITTLEVRKVKVGEETDLSLWIDGYPWVVQPKAGDFLSADRKNFLLAHDITKHVLMQAHGLCNLTTIGGEKLTGEVNSKLGKLPMGEMDYMGIIYYALEQAPHLRAEDNTERELKTMFESLRDTRVPVGTVLRLQFKIFPSDRAYVLKANEMLWHPFTVGESKKILPLSEPIYLQKPAVVEASLKLAKDIGVASSVEFHEGVPFDKVCYFKPIPLEDGAKLFAIYRFVRSQASGDYIEAEKHYEWEDGQTSLMICQQEALLIEQGFRPVANHKTLSEQEISYQKPANPKGITLTHTFTKERQGKRFITTKFFTHYSQEIPCGEQAVYTGYPYHRPQVESITFEIPRELPLRKRKQIAAAVKGNVQQSIQKFKALFAKLQEGVEATLERGELPKSFYQEFFDLLQNQGSSIKRIKLDKSKKDIRSYMLRAYQEEHEPFFPVPEKPFFPEFPPPPFRGPKKKD